MKILLVCNGGMSTGMLAQKIKKYSDSNKLGVEEVVARGMGDYSDICKNFDVILLGPQISNLREDIALKTGMPVGVVEPMDYALGNVQNILDKIDALLKGGC